MTCTEEQKAEIREAVLKVYGKTWGEGSTRSESLALEIIAELTLPPKPEIGPDVPVMFDSLGTKEIMCHRQSMPVDATNIRVLIPDDVATDIILKVAIEATESGHMNAAALGKNMIASYRRGE